MAGAGKLAMPDRFATLLRRFPIAGALLRSKDQARRAGLTLAVVEVAGGALFALGYRTMIVGAVLLTLLAGFSAGVTMVLIRGQRLPCGCLDPLRETPVRWTAIPRNLTLAALVVAGLQPVALSADAALRVRMQPGTFAALAAFCVLLGLVLWHGWLQPASSGMRLALSLGAPAGGSPARRDMVAVEGGGGRGDPDSDVTNGHYQEAVAAHRRASQVVSHLDRELLAVVDDASLDGARVVESATWRDGEARLVELDTVVNGGLAATYQRMLADGGPEAERVLVRTALLHWVVLIRRTAMRTYHTQVEGLTDDPECAGDVIEDDLLLDYFDALFEPRSGVDAEVEAVRALAALARQSACLGQAQSALLASHLYWSFVELRSFLRLSGLERLLPALTQAAMAPMLLFYDVEKYRGLGSPLARWFQESHAALVEGAASGRLPAVWHGLWLYDRHTGHLIGFRPALEPKDENEVHLGLFLDSIISHENLGRFQCSFGEMIERGPSRLGYLCGGVDCANADPKQGIARTIGQLQWWATRVTGIGFSSAQLREAGCGQASGGGSTGGGVGGGGCGGGLKAGGRSRLARTVACLTEQVMQPGEQTMRCIAEAMGMCAGPLEKAAKNLQEALFGGVRLGSRCAIADTADGGPGGVSGQTDKERVEFAENNYGAQLKRTAEAQKEAKEARQAEDKARADAAAASKNYADNPTKANKEARDKANEAYDKASVDRITKENQASYEEGQLKYRQEELKKAYQHQIDYNSVGRCPPDTPGCGDNDCTAMAAAARQTLKCWQQATDPDPNARRPFGGLNPDVVDPSPLDDPSSPSWLKCLGTMPDAKPASKQCWAVDCGPTTFTTLSTTGACGCVEVQGGQVIEGALRGGCGHLDCGEDQSPRVRNGTCTCAPTIGFDVVGSGGPIPVGPKLPATLKSMAEVRGGEIPGVHGPGLPLP
jgi:hypothetical protein